MNYLHKCQVYQVFFPSQLSKTTKKEDEDEDSEDEYDDLEADLESSNKNYIDNIDTSDFQPGLDINNFNKKDF